MIAAKEQFPFMTPEEYFAWEEQQLCRHEYIDGEVYAMSGGTINHSEIALNFGSLLKNHLRGSGCKTLNSDARVSIVNANRYLYPDVSVTCDERDKRTDRYITHPCLIIEVLSDSTEAYDRGDKFVMYRHNPILQDYVLVSSHQVAVDIYRKNDRGNWEIFNYRSPDTIELPSINLSFPIAEIYEDIVFTVNPNFS
jgi:Uma2 family endonuclease